MPVFLITCDCAACGGNLATLPLEIDPPTKAVIAAAVKTFAGHLDNLVAAGTFPTACPWCHRNSEEWTIVVYEALPGVALAEVHAMCAEAQQRGRQHRERIN